MWVDRNGKRVQSSWNKPLELLNTQKADHYITTVNSQHDKSKKQQ